MTTPEEYLKKECYASDRTMEQDINDMLWTKNVLKYMEEYADIVFDERIYSLDFGEELAGM